MSAPLQDFKTATAALPAEDRAELAQFLLRSLDGGEDAEVRAEWLAVGERRMADVKAGKVTGIPAEVVLRTLLDPRP